MEELRDDAEWLRAFIRRAVLNVGDVPRLENIADRLASPEVVTVTEEMIEAVVALADAADKCTEAPHYIVQPFLGVYRKHGETIAKARALSKLSPLVGFE